VGESEGRKRSDKAVVSSNQPNDVVAPIPVVRRDGGHRITLSRRERLVIVEPRDAGMVLITLGVGGGKSGRFRKG